jgi:hypothetical protein
MRTRARCSATRGGVGDAGLDCTETSLGAGLLIPVPLRHDGRLPRHPIGTRRALTGVASVRCLARCRRSPLRTASRILEALSGVDLSARPRLLSRARGVRETSTPIVPSLCCSSAGEAIFDHVYAHFNMHRKNRANHFFSMRIKQLCAFLMQFDCILLALLRASRIMRT